ncbi:MAG: hypothetical protein MH204_03265 [Fimbriimonadaceae bacterium]|nr:hypothetical protein [Fimbriimonadaceae bacterium]
MRLLISTGEASGDAYGAEILKRTEGWDVSASGSTRLAATGARMINRTDRWGAIGVVESVRVGPRVLAGARRVIAELRQGPPGVFLPIDFGFANIRLCRHAKKLGWKVLYFIPPGSWRRDRQGRDLPRLTDAIVTPFPWSAEILRGMGADAHFWGHPLTEMIPEPSLENRQGLAILPGSRIHEVRHTIPLLAPAAARLGLPAAIGLAPNLDPEWVESLWVRSKGGPVQFERDVRGLLARSQAAIVCSGTATLESALALTPTVVVYSVSRWMEMEFRLLRPKIDHISLPNILLNRRLLAELILEDARVDRIVEETEAVLGQAGEDQKDHFRRLRVELSGQGCLDQTARLLAEMRV